MSGALPASVTRFDTRKSLVFKDDDEFVAEPDLNDGALLAIPQPRAAPAADTVGPGAPTAGTIVPDIAVRGTTHVTTRSAVRVDVGYSHLPAAA